MASSTPLTTPSSNPSCALVKLTGDNLDSAWEWNSLKDINNRRSVTCDFCLKTSNGGITRAKKHQMGMRGDVGACKKVPPEIKLKIKEAYDKKKAESDAHTLELKEDDDEQVEVQEIYNIRAGKAPVSADNPAAKRGKTVKGPLDLLYFREPPASIKLGKGNVQTSIQDKEARARTIQYIARCFFKCGISLNVLRDKSFKLMVEAIGNYGPFLKIPSYHEMRVPLLKKELEPTKEMLQPHIVERAKSGCSIMSDAWTDRKNRTLINFMVNCPRGTMFVSSCDASGYVKSGQKIFELLDSFVTEVGEDNVVQVITDNGSNYVLAGRKLQARRHKLFWTPCAAHCIDLMLEDIGKLPKIKTACQRGVSLVSFIYNHTMTLNTIRKYTEKTELVRAGITRFATHFLTLQRLHKQKSNLRRMFISDDWSGLSVSKEPRGKKARDIVLMPSFWNDVLYSIKAMGPLVQVLRLVDNEKKPAMGYIYEAMDRAKETMMKSFNNKEDKYTDIFAIIDKRWQCQLHHPLHAAGHYLNPEFYYGNPDVDGNKEVNEGLLKCIERLSADAEEEDKATAELAYYKRSEGLFSLKAAIRNRTAMAPAEWWKTYGHHVPSLQKIAIRVLSLTCSSSGCERNWSTFQQIHSKKRNKLEHQKLQDLVYIKYNQTLKERFDSRDLIDPIALKDIDLCSEWLTGETGEEGEAAEDDLVFGDDSLTWGNVANVAGVGEPITITRHQKRVRNQAAPIDTQNIEAKVEEDAEQIEHDDDEEELEHDDEEELGDSDS